MCAFNNHHCWPGTCGDLGMTKDCQCAPGFVKRELYGATVNSGETSCQPDVKPVIQTCNTLFIGKDGMKKSSKNAGNQTACDILRDTYGNFQPISIEFKMISSFDVDLTNFMGPPFISKEKFGVTDTMLHIYKEVFKGNTRISKQTVLNCDIKDNCFFSVIINFFRSEQKSYIFTSGGTTFFFQLLLLTK